jgi:hypothetical protein
VRAKVKNAKKLMVEISSDDSKFKGTKKYKNDARMI